MGSAVPPQPPYALALGVLVGSGPVRIRVFCLCWTPVPRRGVSAGRMPLGAGGALPRGRCKKAFEIPSMLPLLSSPRAYFFLPCIPFFFGRCVTWPQLVWRLPVALGPRVSNDLLSVRAQTPVTRCSLRLSTTAGRPVGGDPISPTASLHGPEIQRAASTSPKAQGGLSTAIPLTPL